MVFRDAGHVASPSVYEHFRPCRQLHVLSAERCVSRSVEPTPLHVDSFQHSTPDAQYCARCSCAPAVHGVFIAFVSVQSALLPECVCPHRSSNQLHLSFAFHQFGSEQGCPSSQCRCSLGQLCRMAAQDDPLRLSATRTEISTGSQGTSSSSTLSVSQGFAG